MNSPELKEWLGKDESAEAGWSKDDGSRETVGQERYGKSLLHSKPKPLFLLPFCSVRKIIKILEKNPAGTRRSMIRRILTICEEWWPTTSAILFRNMQMANLANRLRTGVMMHRRVDAGKEGQLFFGASTGRGQDEVGIGWD